jgi:hypothetical protein
MSNEGKVSDTLLSFDAHFANGIRSDKVRISSQLCYLQGQGRRLSTQTIPFSVPRLRICCWLQGGHIKNTGYSELSLIRGDRSCSGYTSTVASHSRETFWHETMETSSIGHLDEAMARPSCMPQLEGMQFHFNCGLVVG